MKNENLDQGFEKITKKVKKSKVVSTKAKKKVKGGIIDADIIDGR